MIAALVVAMLTQADGGLPQNGDDYVPSHSWPQTVEVNTDIPVALPGSAAATLSTPAPDGGVLQEIIIQLQAGQTFWVPGDGLYLNEPAAVHAANDRLAVQDASLLMKLLPPTVAAVVSATAGAIVTYYATHKH